MARKKSSLKGRIVTACGMSDHPLTPKELARQLKIPYSSTIRKYCRDLLADGELILWDGKRAQYITPGHVVTEHKAIYEPLLLHGIKLEFRYNSKQAPPFLPLARQVTFRGHRHPKNRSISDSFEFDGRKITVTEHATAGLVEVFVTAHDNCYNFTEFQRFVAWVQGRYPLIPMGSWEVIMLGLNWDRKDIGLEGLSKVSLQAFDNCWLVIYQKTKEIVRTEAHIVTKIDLADCLQILMEMQHSIEQLKLIRR